MSGGNEDVIVDSKSLIEWLESRRKLDKDWVNKFKGVTLKYQDIVKHAKEKRFPAVNEFLEARQKDFSYLDLLKLLELLKATPEAESKNLFGSYTSPLLKEITSLIKLLEKSNLHLADIGKHLSHLVNFEGPSVQKLKQTSVNDIKQFEAKIVTVKNSMSKMQLEKNEYLAANQLQEGQLESCLTKRVFTLPKHLDSIVQSVRSIKNFGKCLQNYYKMSQYLNGESEEIQRLKALETLEALGDFPLRGWKSGDETPKPQFDYIKHFNLRGFYDFSAFEVTGTSGADNWGIEEVGDSNKWQIEETAPEKAGASAEQEKSQLEDVRQGTVLLDSEFRDQLSGELELLVYYFTERKNQASVSNPLLLLDGQLAKLNNEVSLEEIQEFIRGVEAVRGRVEEPQFKQNLSFYESEKGKERLRAAVDSFTANLKRKERQLWKLEDNIKELKANVDDADEQLRKLNKTINDLRLAAEQQLSLLVKRTVVVPKVTL